MYQKEGIEFEQIMQFPDIHFSKELIEKLHPSEVIRSSKRTFANHLLKYYAARYQDSIDAIVKCFIKSTRLMQFRANKSYDERSGKDSRSFLQHNNAQFQDILDAMKSGNISVLEDYQEFFEMVAQKTGYYHKKEGYFAAPASRCTYSRILSKKIVFLNFKGLDESSNILVETLKEVFEPLILITLAHKQQELALFLMLIMNAIVFYNKAVFGERIAKELDGVTMHPAFWQYINFIGKYNV